MYTVPIFQGVKGLVFFTGRGPSLGWGDGKWEWHYAVPT
jgi:hypothetical protein